MLFHEYSFLFLFLPLTVVGYFLSPKRWRNAALLIASVIFYSVSSLVYLPILFVSTLIDYVVGGRIADARSQAARRALLITSITSNLCILGFFKYAGFFTATLHESLGFRGIPILEVALPVGISFYTFQSMSYSIDVYRGGTPRSRSLIDFGAFVTLFPQLIAGPIVRYRELEDQLRAREESATLALDGLDLFITGLAKKLLLADTAATIADPIFSAGSPSVGAAWVAVLAYGAQIYFDFSGYSDMARGLGKLFGFEFPVNFDSPYKADSFRDFWRRWHMTLSRWLRDNVYIPLGGSHHGQLRTAYALFATMLLGGLWHGASWSFVIWGGLHGLFLGVERALGAVGALPAPPRWMRRAIVLLGVMIAWVFFRVEGTSEALQWLGAMVGRGSSGPAVEPLGLAALAFFYAVMLLAPNSDELDRRPTTTRLLVLITLFVASLVAGYGRGISPFLYFRF